LTPAAFDIAGVYGKLIGGIIDLVACWSLSTMPLDFSSQNSLTTMLNHVNGGHEGAFGRLVDAVYNDLRRVAANRMQKEFQRPIASLTESRRLE